MSQDQVFWYLNRPSDVTCLRTSLEADVVIIGAGMAGLTTAQAFAHKNKNVVLLEAYYCGAGASGKSSGFVTPNSEVSLSEFIERYGDVGGKNIWASIDAGVKYIQDNIQRYSIDCDYEQQDSLFVANTARAVKKLREEDENLQKFFTSPGFVEKQELSYVLGSDKYHGGVIYKDTFGMNAYKYCQAMKKILLQQGVHIFEETPVLDFKNNSVMTLHGTVKAKNIIVCADRFIPNFGKLTTEIYHGQNFLLMSQPLSEPEIKAIFPQRNLMVWDTELIYNYFRMSGNRLLLGGGSLINFYNKHEEHNSRYVYHKLTHYFKKQFPLIDVQFEQFWPGLIGVSKDVAPISGFDKDDASVYYISAAGGLPVAAALGIYCADRIVDGRDDLQDYFSPYRHTTIPGWANSVLGTKLSFALSNFMAVSSQ